MNIKTKIYEMKHKNYTKHNKTSKQKKLTSNSNPIVIWKEKEKLLQNEKQIYLKLKSKTKKTKKETKTQKLH